MTFPVAGVAARCLVAIAVAKLLAFGWSGSVRADDGVCPRVADEVVTLRAVEPRLELRLSDGRVLRLVGLDPVEQTPTAPDRADQARDALAAMLAGHDIAIRVLSSAPDRWGRLPAFAFARTGPATSAEGGIATAAVAAGLGRYRAEDAAHTCRGALLAAEAQARQAKLGLWADPYYAVLAVDERAAFAERSGTIVVTEGRLIEVLPGPYRTKLRFAAPSQGSYGGHTLSATVPPHVMKTFEAKGVIPSTLIGRTLRLRGLLDLRFGPRIELASPDDVEVVTPASGAPTRGQSH